VVILGIYVTNFRHPEDMFHGLPRKVKGISCMKPAADRFLYRLEKGLLDSVKKGSKKKRKVKKPGCRVLAFQIHFRFLDPPKPDYHSEEIGLLSGSPQERRLQAK
jgi:hypothetical protein